MKRRNFRRILTGMLAASLVAGQPGVVAFAAPQGNDASVNEVENVDVDFQGAGTTEATEEKKEEKYITVSIPGTPTGGATATTWDCIWFGNYWQGDTNEDGYCFSRDVTIKKSSLSTNNSDMVFTYVEDLGMISGSVPNSVAAGAYSADAKQPIKWRVLSIDKDGNALLLADKNIETNGDSGEYTGAWATCALRSLLNSYAAESNSDGKDYSTDGFLTNAFSVSESAAISTTKVSTPRNPVYETEGGDDTQDKIFLLSIDEAMNEGYGFKVNSFTEPASEEGIKFYTAEDATRVAKNTAYVYFKPGSYGNAEGMAQGWFLRTPGSYEYNEGCTSKVSETGAVYADLEYTEGNDALALRPALYLNLSSNTALWRSAGTVCSDGTVDEEASFQGTGATEIKVKVEDTSKKDDEAAKKAAEEAAKKAAEEAAKKAAEEEAARLAAEEAAKKAAEEEAAKKAAEETAKINASIPDEQGVVKAFYEDAVQSDIVMIPGELKRLSLTPSDSYIFGVKWSVDAAGKRVVKVKDGVVTASKPGTATVTATYRDTALTFKITVVNEKEFKSKFAVAGKKGYVLKAMGSVKTSTDKTGAKLTLALPSKLKGATVTVDMLDASGNVIAKADASGTVDASICSIGAATANSKGNKLTYVVTAKDAGAAFVRFTASYEENAVSQALTKLIITKSVSDVEASVNKLTLKPGEGKRLVFTENKANTIGKAPTFKVKGKGIKVTKSGYVVGVTPGASGTVTIKAGNVKKTVSVEVTNDGEGKNIFLNKISVSKKMGKASTYKLVVKTKKRANAPASVSYRIVGDTATDGISVANDGTVSIAADAKPGCYSIIASADGFTDGYTELIVK